MARVIKNWLEYQDLPIHAINVACKTCGRDMQSSPISFKSNSKPYLVINTHSQNRMVQQRRRHVRQTNCTPGLNECCRESLYVSFEEIGWNDWIIRPAGYNAYFCKGSCSTAASITLSATQHNSILQVSNQPHSLAYVTSSIQNLLLTTRSWIWYSRASFLCMFDFHSSFLLYPNSVLRLLISDHTKAPC